MANCMRRFFTLFVITIFVAMADTMLTRKRNESEFKLLCETRSASGNIPVQKYVSRKTGLHVVIAKIEGPLVQGFFTIATEALDDDGLPHTLEHLVFLGSEEYPYKGVLDLLANRCLAEGTNAWTDVDHTAYTIMTAGSEGFLNLLPIYLDHLLYPTLTDAGFTTEVYHITGEGEDAGVVYSEMQGRENKGTEVTYRTMIRLLYPETSGYHYQTGGIMSNLRNNITNLKVRNYHKEMYRPENLHIIISGQVEPNEVFKALQPIEDKIYSKGDRGPFQRPWESQVPSISKSEDIEIVYPSDTEDTGIVRVAWRGPSLVSNIQEFQSMEALLKYLTDLSVSPLPNVFVEVEDPLASEIEEYMLENAISSSVLTFLGVPKNKINKVKPLLIETLNDIVEDKIPFDLEVMKNILKNIILKEDSEMESEPHDTMASSIITDLLYGHSCNDLYKIMNKKSWIESLMNQPSEYWKDLIEKFLIKSPSIVVRGVPSIAESKRIQEKEKLRVKERISKFGNTGLKKWEEKVSEANQINKIAPPDSLLELVPVPSVDKINFHYLKVFTNIANIQSGLMSDPTLLNMDAIPVKMQLDDIKSNFVQIIAILDTSSLDNTQRMYLQLLLDLLLESPIRRGNKIIPYEEVVKNLNADVVKAETINGLTLSSETFEVGQYFSNVVVNFKVEIANYEKGVDWLKEILFHVIFDHDRVRVKVNKLINSVGEKKRDGSKILKLMYNDVVFKTDANANMLNVLRQETFLNEVLEMLQKTPERVLKNLEDVYQKITELDNITIHMATSLKKLARSTNVTEPWTDFKPNDRETSSLTLNIITDSDQRIPFDNRKRTTGFIAGIGSVESAYLMQTTPAISTYTHPDLPALMTAISYLTQLEGPMWKEIRGKGLAYSYQIMIKPHEGMLTLKLARAAQLVDAYKEAQRLIMSYINGSTTWDRLLFESARSALIFDIIQREAEVSDVVQQSLFAYYRKVPHTYNQDLLNEIAKVTINDLERVARKYFKLMLDPQQSQTVIVCQPSKADAIQAQLNQIGHDLEVKHNITGRRIGHNLEVIDNIEKSSAFQTSGSFPASLFSIGFFVFAFPKYT